jgi:hydroxymethylpyrimidine/phosphomethylpyrimidine kinase
MKNSKITACPVALSIAGWDPCGGAGILADHKTFHAHGVYALGAITAITVQNTQAVSSVSVVQTELLESQITNLLDDFKPDAIKIGMLGNLQSAKVVNEIIKSWQRIPIILDPVTLSSSDFPLLSTKGQEFLKNQLLRNITLLTPNLAEAEWLSGIKIKTKKQIEQAADLILKLGVSNLVIKGGHIEGNPDDFFASQTQKMWYPGIRQIGHHTRGTGCIFSAAITANLALGNNLPNSIKKAKRYISEAIKSELYLGGGNGLAWHNPPPPANDINREP